MTTIHVFDRKFKGKQYIHIFRSRTREFVYLFKTVVNECLSHQLINFYRSHVSYAYVISYLLLTGVVVVVRLYKFMNESV